MRGDPPAPARRDDVDVGGGRVAGAGAVAEPRCLAHLVVWREVVEWKGTSRGRGGIKKISAEKVRGAAGAGDVAVACVACSLVWVARPIAAALQAFERFYRERGPGGREGKAGSGLGGPDNGRCGRPTFPDLQPSPAGRGKCDSHKRPPPVATSSSGSGCSSLPCYHPAVKNDRHGGSQTNVFA